MSDSEWSSVAAIAPTLAGAVRLLPLCRYGVQLWVSENVAQQAQQQGLDLASAQVYSMRLRQQVQHLWANRRALIFGLATGAVVRLIAPLLADKAADPAVVVVDDAGTIAISLCGGHQGGGDRLTHAVAAALNLTPIITGASNALGFAGIDVLGMPFGWRKGTGDWTAVSAAIVHQQPVQVNQTAGNTLWRNALPQQHPFQFATTDQAQAAQIHITVAAPTTLATSVYWHPRLLWVGIGCERGTSAQLIDAAIRQTFQSYGLAEAAIAGIASLDLKADEVGLLEVCQTRQLPLQCYSAETLRIVSVPHPSTIVEAEVGTPSVAEAAAIQAAVSMGRWSENDAIAADARLIVPKQIVKQEAEPGAVTVAVAQAAREYVGRNGQLWLIGTGPGDLSQITPAAKTAIAQADAIVGYELYVDYVRPLLQPGQLVEAMPITQERQRAKRAIELAQWGLTVAVISSGDCGIYGMAGLVLEDLQSQGWDGKHPTVQCFPGITALQAAAARVGAPLMHDFCAISLSDLLTPWEVIEKRLTAAAQADFVTALYNPKSRTRTEQIAIAHRIFLQHRQPDTPVAIVRSAYRPDEEVIITTLAHLLEWPIDMVTVILIGNATTRIHTQWIITPRGYFPQLVDGS